MKVELKEIHAKNFRCFDDKVFNFGHNTVVRGTNGVGKSTLFDAFTFTLFGKDSSGRADFGYKRRDANGNIIHELEYGCEVVFDVDGVEKRFERVVSEKWTKPRGAKEKVLSGNECSYYVDRVRCATKKEYDAAVVSIVSEDVFRIMTDVYYFISQKDDYKKVMLLKMAYGTTNSQEADEMVVQEVLTAYPQFSEFMRQLNGATVREFNTTIGAKIRAISDEIAEIPTKIAAKKETVPAEEDWDGLQTIINENKTELENIERQIADENARQAGATEVANKFRVELSNKQLELLQVENAIRSKVSEQEASVRNQFTLLDGEYRMAMTERGKVYEQLGKDRDALASLEAQLAEKRTQFRAIKDGTLQYTEAELVCPTCHRPYDREKLTEHKLQENKLQGIAIRVEYDRIASEITILEKKHEELLAKCSQLEQQKQALAYQHTDVTQLILNDENCSNIRHQIDEINAQLATSVATATTSTLVAAKREIESKIEGFQKQLGMRDVIARVNKQIEELEERQAILNNELATLERMQDTAKEFQKAKDRQLLEKVNHLFTIVTWDFVSEQYNGNDKIACNCYVDGMPYSERNHAGKVNAGLDIINAIARCEGISLPIFIDNAESVVEYLPTESQKILLMVDASAKELTFELK